MDAGVGFWEQTVDILARNVLLEKIRKVANVQGQVIA